MNIKRLDARNDLWRHEIDGRIQSVEKEKATETNRYENIRKMCAM